MINVVNRVFWKPPVFSNTISTIFVVVFFVFIVFVFCFVVCGYFFRNIFICVFPVFFVGREDELFFEGSVVLWWLSFLVNKWFGRAMHWRSSAEKGM